jgi:hypothetical protein
MGKILLKLIRSGTFFQSVSRLKNTLEEKGKTCFLPNNSRERFMERCSGEFNGKMTSKFIETF